MPTKGRHLSLNLICLFLGFNALLEDEVFRCPQDGHVDQLSQHVEPADDRQAQVGLGRVQASIVNDKVEVKAGI